MRLTSTEINNFKNKFLEIYDRVLPYTAKNGTSFENNGALELFENDKPVEGLVIATNGYLGGNSYYPILEHIRVVNDGSDCITNINCIDLGIEDLELLSIEIKKKI